MLRNNYIYRDLKFSKLKIKKSLLMAFTARIGPNLLYYYNINWNQ